MRLSNLTIALLTAGLVANLLARPRRAQPAGAGSDLPGAASGGESPNAAERLAQSHAGGVYAGIGESLPAQDGGNDLRLFPSGASGGNGDAITPGLPDFSRGA